MSTILVTGAAGFLGSNLTELLMAGGYDVIALDNFYSGRMDNLYNLAEREELPGSLTLVTKDVCQPSWVNDYPCDAIAHLACPASPVAYQANPIFTIDTAFFGVRNVLQAADKWNARVLFTSTSEVYGDPRVHPQTEDYWGNVNPFGPRSCYDEGKRVGEALCYAWMESKSIDVRIARIFNTYGPNMQVNDGRVVSNFISQALRNKPITVYGDGSQTRSLCYVDDTVNALALLLLDDELDSDCPKIYNVGNPDEIRIIDLAKKIVEMIDTDSQIELSKLPADDPTVRCPDISRIENEFGWTPKVDLQSGLVRTIDYFRDALVENGPILVHSQRGTR